MALAESMGELMEDVAQSNVVSDISEIGHDTAQLSEDVVAVGRSRVVGGVFLVVGGLALSGYAGYLVGVKRTVTRYEKLMAEETERTKVFYTRLAKDGEFESPESAAAALIDKEVVEKAADALRTYQGEKPPKTTTKVEVSPTVPGVTIEVESDGEEITTNVFDERRSPHPWNQEVENARRLENPDDPYVISTEEFAEGVIGHSQAELVYFEEDEVLVDEREVPVDNVEYTVGEDNLSRFGEGSDDPNVLYIRNDNTSMDFTVVRSKGSYSDEVAGPAPEIRHSHSGSRRSRRSADE